MSDHSHANGGDMPDHLALLEPRHVDNLVEMMRTLNRSIVELTAAIQRQLLQVAASATAKRQRKRKTASR